MSTTGWPGGPSVKTGAPVIDYASGLNAAFAVVCALYQRAQTGRGQRIDCAMLDTALPLMSSILTSRLYTGAPRRPRGNDLDHPGVCAYETRDDVLMLGSFRAGQHRRLWTGLGRPDLAALSSVEEQEGHRERMAAALREAMAARTAAEWERFLVEINLPRARNLLEALGLDQARQRGFLHRYDAVPRVERPITVPVAIVSGAPARSFRQGTRAPQDGPETQNPRGRAIP
jgi:crotonobetainyl-CoA:carnitine CoA-transferase CaiB-like acyl-CoA transferase